VEAVPRAEADEALFRMTFEDEAEAVPARRRRDDAMVRAERLDREVGRVDRVLERLLRDHALRQLDELVIRAAFPRTQLHPA
jgi:hypothetical protein